MIEEKILIQFKEEMIEKINNLIDFIKNENLKQNQKEIDCKKKFKNIWILDPGHGGINPDGEYVTEGKQFHFSKDNISIYEGVVNREIVDNIKELNRLNDNMFTIYDTTSDFRGSVRYVDIPLRERVNAANKIYDLNLDSCVYFMSLHINAGGGTGFEVYTTKGLTKADGLATIFYHTFQNVIPDMRLRMDMSDGDPDKEENWYVIKNTKMPAILVEFFFMDNILDVEKYYLDRNGFLKICNACFVSMCQCCNTIPIKLFDVS